ncbi:origin of replication complex subunit 3 isoform X1 [Tanacetum coccineum]
MRLAVRRYSLLGLQPFKRCTLFLYRGYDESKQVFTVLSGALCFYKEVMMNLNRLDRDRSHLGMANYWICSHGKTVKEMQRMKVSPSPKKRKMTAEPQNITEASVQARFCRAVTELQITGLLRMPSKRRPDFVQRVTFMY